MTAQEAYNLGFTKAAEIIGTTPGNLLKVARANNRRAALMKLAAGQGLAYFVGKYNPSVIESTLTPDSLYSALTNSANLATTRVPYNKRPQKLSPTILSYLNPRRHIVLGSEGLTSRPAPSANVTTNAPAAPAGSR